MCVFRGGAGFCGKRIDDSMMDISLSRPQLFAKRTRELQCLPPHAAGKGFIGFRLPWFKKVLVDIPI